ncbi:unnamed protein product [Cylicocyclus nassatus]|uniref:7TM GPCR serpentine receptor class x (Srx) domain-containing protein n=1 Tax=Cylicocyclus nassatus TaxID=53992 RepID=A0AA36H1G3_CYLNA|nr:unnamed protein product [Cylicocyclus nassatus]
MSALLFPLKYERICPVEAAWFFIGVGICFGLYWIIHMLVFNCRYVYNAKMMSWKYVNCDYMDKKLNFIYPVLIMTGTILVLNSLVATVLIFKRRSVAAHHQSKKNLRMFWQSFVQDLFNCNDCIWQCFLSPLVDSRIWVFWADTIVWELSPICDGTVAMLFDTRLRRPFWSRKRHHGEVTQTRSVFVSAVTKSTHQ